MAFVALVTGASAGIGAAAARRLAREPDARLILVARRADRLQALAEELGGATVIAVDLTDPDAPRQVREVVEAEHGELHLLVNNAGASWRGRFADAGWANVERHMRLDFEAPVRLTEALLPVLRATAAPRSATAAPPRDGAAVSIVNVASTASRVARPGAAGYSAAKFALAGWTDGLHLEEREHGIHVGLVLPGFVKTEGFPTTELLARRATRWMVSTPEVVAEAIVEAGPGGRPERYVPRFYWIFAAVRIVAPRLMRRAIGGGAFTTMTDHR
jgi:short-subunit dehydrogenase